MITADDAPLFPACPTYGFTGGPDFLVKITKREGGFERRQRVWDRPLSSYTAVPLGDQHQDDIEDVYYFWMAIGGTSSCFRFQDQLDYKSCRLSETPEPTDQPLEPRTGGGYRLIKEYVAGGMTQLRDIQRPIGSTIEIANEVGVAQPGSAWTLDESTGVVTTNGGFSGTPTSWGGQFHVWARFDQPFAPTFSNFKILNASIQLLERRQALA